MLTEAQLAQRMAVIGGSDAPAVCGVCCNAKGDRVYRTADDVLQEKLGFKKEPDARLKECGEWGDIMEPHLVKRYRELYPSVKLTRPKKMFIHPRYPFMGCHLDGLLYHPHLGRGVFEAKTIRHAPKEIQNHYHYVQLQHNIEVLGVQWGVIAALIGGNEFKVFILNRDEELISKIIAIETAFWNRVLDARKEQAA